MCFFCSWSEWECSCLRQNVRRRLQQQLCRHGVQQNFCSRVHVDCVFVGLIEQCVNLGIGINAEVKEERIKGKVQEQGVVLTPRDNTCYSQPTYANQAQPRHPDTGNGDGAASSSVQFLQYLLGLRDNPSWQLAVDDTTGSRRHRCIEEIMWKAKQLGQLFLYLMRHCSI